MPNYADSLGSFLTRNPDSALPSSSTSASSGLPSVYTDDDAIDLVFRFEGGFFEDPKHPSGAVNHGITTAE